jgi:hypothetical protein
MPEESFNVADLHDKHALFEPFVGSFRATVKLWMGDADEPMATTGTMVNRLDLGGRYLHQHYTGDQVDGPYPHFEGRGYWGYNTLAQRFEGFWIDNASTIMMTEAGRVDDDGKVWTMTSELPHPDGGTVMRTTLIKLEDNDHHTMESFMRGPDGVEKKTMEIEYVRA